MTREMETDPFEGKVKELSTGIFSLQKGRQRGNIVAFFKHLKDGHRGGSGVVVFLSSQNAGHMMGSSYRKPDFG